MLPGRADPGLLGCCQAAFSPAKLRPAAPHLHLVGLPRSLSLQRERGSEKEQHQTPLPHLKDPAWHSAWFPSPVSSALAFTSLLLLLLPACQPEVRLNPNSSVWDTEYRELLQRILPEATESHKFTNPWRSNSFLSREEQRQLLLSQNLTAKIDGSESSSCDLLQKFSRDLLIKAFGPNLSSNIIQLHNCDRPEDQPQIHLHLQKPLHSKVKPSFLYRALKVLKDMGVQVKVKQPKMFSLQRQQMLRTRKSPLKPDMKQSVSFTKNKTKPKRKEIGVLAFLDLTLGCNMTYIWVLLTQVKVVWWRRGTFNYRSFCHCCVASCVWQKPSLHTWLQGCRPLHLVILAAEA